MQLLLEPGISGKKRLLCQEILISYSQLLLKEHPDIICQHRNEKETYSCPMMAKQRLKFKRSTYICVLAPKKSSSTGEWGRERPASEYPMARG